MFQLSQTIPLQQTILPPYPPYRHRSSLQQCTQNSHAMTHTNAIKKQPHQPCLPELVAQPQTRQIIYLNSTFQYPNSANFIKIDKNWRNWSNIDDNNSSATGVSSTGSHNWYWKLAKMRKFMRMDGIEGKEGTKQNGEFLFDVFDLRNRSYEGNTQDQSQGSHGNNPELVTKNPKKSKETQEGQGVNINLDFSSKKPQPFMGAFLQTQTQFNCFDLNIKIPPLKSVLPFSRILSESIVGQTLNQKQHQKSCFNKNKDNLNLENNEKKRSQDKEQQVFLNLSLYQSQYQQSQNQFQHLTPTESPLLPMSNLSLSKIQPIPQPPIFQNFNIPQSEQLHKSFVQSSMWQPPSPSSYSSQSPVYQFHRSLTPSFISSIESKTILQPSLSSQNRKCQELTLCNCMVKMVLNVESSMFLLDYHFFVWKFMGMDSLGFENFLRNSLDKFIQDVIQICNYKSRLEVAVKFVKKQMYRRILQEVALQVKNFLFIVQEIVLEVVQRKGSVLDFVISLSEIKSQMKLVYQLLINESQIKSQNKSYMDFDISFLNSQAVIFRQIVRMSNTNDSLIGKSYELFLRLLRAAFKPITFTLNRIAFQETVQISNRDDTYLRYYFQNLKDLLSYLGKRIDLIKQESNQLYMICRLKEEIKIVVESGEIQQYIRKWNQIFQTKRKMIQDVQKREKKRLKEEKQKKEEDKIKEIYQLKTKLLKSIQETKQRKSEIYLEGVKEIERLKKQIMDRQERRRLNYLIEKEQQKGFLLQAELKQKRKLIQQKEQLLAIAQKQGLILIQQVLKKQKIIQQLPSQTTESLKMFPQQKNQSQPQPKMQQVQIISPTPSIPSITSVPPAVNQIKPSSGQPIKHQTSLQSKVIPEQKQAQKQKQQNTSLNQHSNSNLSMNKISSYAMKSLQKFDDSSHSSQPQPQPEQKQQQPQSESESEPQSSPPSCPQTHVSTNTTLQISIDWILRRQIDITNSCLSYLVFEQYQLVNIMEFMRKIFLAGKGDLVGAFLDSCVAKDSGIDLQYFVDCVLFDDMDGVRGFGPCFYLNQSGVVNIFQDGLDAVGFQFSKLPPLLQPYFSYIHLGKYMQIFAHIIKIKHCQSLISNCLLSLNELKSPSSTLPPASSPSFLSSLYVTRHSIHLYLHTLQSYLFSRIIEKQQKLFLGLLRPKAPSSSAPPNINQLPIHHLNMLDSIIRRGLIENPHNDISKRIKGLLADVRKFANIVDSYCANDIHGYVRGEVERVVGEIRAKFCGELRILSMLLCHP